MILFISNFFNHHQEVLCNQLFKLTEGNFLFIATERIPFERTQLGYLDMNQKYPFILRAYENENSLKRSFQLCSTADVVIIGSASDEYIKRRLSNLVTLKYSERPYKDGFFLRNFFSEIMHHYRFKRKNIALLCASSYTAYDHAKFGMYKGRAYKWGYFPETKKYIIDELISKKDHTKILWVGRFLDWKHPDDALRVANKLKDDGYSFTMDIVGTGVMEKQLKEMTATLGLTDCVRFPGSVPSDQVRDFMENAGIYMFTSDRNEGWGAVLNESMNSGCAVVASHAIGAVPYLMKHQENGLVYHSGNVDELYEKVKYLLDYPEEQEQLGRAAYETITGEWNAEVAAKRLITLSEHLLAGEKHPDLYQTGPCSRAEIIKDDWFYE